MNMSYPFRLAIIVIIIVEIERNRTFITIIILRSLILMEGITQFTCVCEYECCVCGMLLELYTMEPEALDDDYNTNGERRRIWSLQR